MARRTNYGFEKKQREQRKQKKKQEKAERRGLVEAPDDASTGDEATDKGPTAGGPVDRD